MPLFRYRQRIFSRYVYTMVISDKKQRDSTLSIVLQIVGVSKLRGECRPLDRGSSHEKLIKLRARQFSTKQIAPVGVHRFFLLPASAQAFRRKQIDLGATENGSKSQYSKRVHLVVRSTCEEPPYTFEVKRLSSSTGEYIGSQCR